MMDLPKEVFGINFKPSLEKENKGGVESLAQQWAKNYLQNLDIDEDDKQTTNKVSLKEAVSQAGREKTAYKLMESLGSISAKAWNKTESLLAAEVKRHLKTSRYASTLVGAYFQVIDACICHYNALMQQRLNMIMILIPCQQYNNSYPIAHKLPKMFSKR